MLVDKWEYFWSIYGGVVHLLEAYRKEFELAEERRRLFPESRSALYHELRARIGLGQIDLVEKSAEGFHTLSGGTNPGYAFLGLAYELRKHGYEQEAVEFTEKALDWYRSRPEEELKTYRRQYQMFDILFFNLFGFAESLTEPVFGIEDSDTRFGTTRGERLITIKTIAENLNASYGKTTQSFYGRARYGMLMARLGEREKAMEVFDWLDRFSTKYSYGYNIAWKARIAAHLGDLDRAMALLHDAFRKGHPIRDYFHANPTWDPLRGHPQFQAFIQPK
jgi:tetratricopeptide (TPR) repeat protein